MMMMIMKKVRLEFSYIRTNTWFVLHKKGVWTLKFKTATQPFVDLSDMQHGTFKKSTWRNDVF